MNKVDAVKTKEEIETVETLLRKHHGGIYADIWRIGVNLGLRSNDLLALTYSGLVDKQNSTFYSFSTDKTCQELEAVVLDSVTLKIIERRKKDNPNDHYIFQVKSNRTKSKLIKPVSRISVSRAFKDVGERLRLNINTLSMRKSSIWAKYADGLPIENLRQYLNHSSKEMTMAYIGIKEQ